MKVRSAPEARCPLFILTHTATIPALPPLGMERREWEGLYVCVAGSGGVQQLLSHPFSINYQE